MPAVRCQATQQHSEYLFVIGLGYTGRAISNTTRKSGRNVSGTCRGLEQQERLRAQGLHAIHIDDAPLNSKEMLAILQKATHVLCTIPPSMLDTQVVELLAASAASLEHLKWMGYLSTTSVYGDWSGAWVDESCAIRPSSQKAKQRAETEAAWLSLYQEHQLPVHCFRLGGIYGPGRSALDAAQQQGVASASQKRRGLQRYTARPRSVHKPAEKRVSNHKIKTELGLTWDFPSFVEGLSAIHAGDMRPFD
ncbi:hypothetical protein WJX82_009356 [Trebouxia sp. C0006]